MKLRSMLPALFAGLLFSAAGFGQFTLTDKIPLDPDVKTGKLSNGLTYYIRKNTMPEKKLELRLAINAGSILENDNQRGLAHFMEHMSFNGSKHFPKNELVDFLQRSGVQFGADLNAYTSFDETVYILPLPTEDTSMIDKGFTVLEDWAFNNLLDKAEIEKERGVVLEESRLSKGSFERMSRKYFPSLLNGSKYASRLPIGKDEVLKTFQLETLKQFYKNWYRPNLMAVIVVGDIDPAEAERQIIKHFGSYKNPVAAPARPTVIPIAQRTKPQGMVVTDPEATSTYVQIYNYVKPATEIKTWNDYRASIVENVVSSLISQRLAQLTESANPPFVFANTGFGGFVRGYTSFNSIAVLGEGSLQDAITALISETQRAKQFGFLQSELDRIKASMLNSADKAVKEKDKSNSSALVSQYLGNFLTATPVPGVANRLAFLQQVLPTITLEEINAFAKKMPSTNNAYTLVQAPEDMKAKLPDNAGLLAMVNSANNKPVKAYEEKAVASALMKQSPVAGKVTEETKNDKLGTTNYTLSNGVTISVKPTTFKNDEIILDAWRVGGYHHANADDKLTAMTTGPLVVTMGVNNMAPSELKKFLAGKTVSVMPYVNPDEEGIEGRSSIKDFETFLQLIHLYFTSPRKDETIFKSFISSQKSFLAYAQNDPGSSYNDTLQKIIYKNNPWADGIPAPADYDKITLDKIMSSYQSFFGNAYGMHFTFVGNVDLEKAKPLFEKYLASLPASPKENKPKDVGLRLLQGHTEVAIKRGKEQQATINLFFEGEMAYTPENNMKLGALLEVLNIKIIEKLREDMSGMYGGGLNGSLQKRPYEHYSIQASIPCGPENVDKLTTALLAIIRDAQEKGIDQKDLDKVKETWRKHYHSELKSNDFWLTALSEAFINQSNPEEVFRIEQRIDALTVQDIQAAAKKFLTLDNMVKSVLYPVSSKVPEGVKTLKGF